MTKNSDAFDLPDAAWRRGLRRRLLAWYRRHARDLPWRGDRDPYRIWVSEIMLQQTQVATVVDYYKRFLRRFPDVTSLAVADEQEVLRMWEGLGYYRRARQMHKAARRIVSEHGAVFPSERDDVLALPGVGRYTAGAILSIAHDARMPILEANTFRLLSRLLAHADDLSLSFSQRRLWAFAEEILPRVDVGAFNQALMELGGEVCRPRAPRCAECPLWRQCPTYAEGRQEEIPAPKRKMHYEEVREVAAVVRRDARVLVRQCGPTERWSGMWDFPRFPLEDRHDSEVARAIADGVSELTGYQVKPGPRLLTIKHGVTRFRITLDCHAADLSPKRQRNGRDDLRWLTPAQLQDTPLSVTGRKICEFLSDEG